MYDQYPEYRTRLDDRIQQMESAKAIGEITQILSSIVDEPVSSLEGDVCTVFSGDVIDYYAAELTLIRCVSRVVLPVEPFSVRLLSSWSVGFGWNEDGWVEPHDKSGPVLEFRYDDCFTTRMTDRGRSMARTLGQNEIQPTHYGRYSV